MIASFADILRRGAAYLVDCAIVFGAFAVTQVFLFTPIRQWFGIDESWFQSGWNTQV